MKKHALASLAAAGLIAAGLGTANADSNFSLSYFMGPAHPMNKAVFTPFAEKLAELSGGSLTVQQFPGGALNSAPPKQYSILRDGVADIAFALPGYTAQLFPKTNVVTVPTICPNAIECTEALIRAKDLIEGEYDAKLLAVWANAAPVLLTRDKQVKTLEDLKGMKVRVTSATDVPFMEALGASAVSQPVNVINQNLANGVIDAIAIGPSAIGSFKLHEPANFITVGPFGSGSAFVLLMNRGIYDALSDEEKGWIEEASGDWLSRSGGAGFQAAADRGMKLAADSGVEVFELPADEVARFEAALEAPLADFAAMEVGDAMAGDVISVMRGDAM